MTEVECIGSIVSVYLQCRLQIHCTYTATCWQGRCSAQNASIMTVTVYYIGIYSVGTVYTAVCSVSAVYEQPILQGHVISCNVPAVYTAWHCRYTALWSGMP